MRIDSSAYQAGSHGIARIVFDMTDAPVRSMAAMGSFTPPRDVFVQGGLDASVLDLVSGLGWLPQVLDYLPHLCLSSLRALAAHVQTSDAFDTETYGSTAALAKIEAAISEEVEREKHFYGDE